MSVIQTQTSKIYSSQFLFSSSQSYFHNFISPRYFYVYRIIPFFQFYRRFPLSKGCSVSVLGYVKVFIIRLNYYSGRLCFRNACCYCLRFLKKGEQDDCPAALRAHWPKEGEGDGAAPLRTHWSEEEDDDGCGPLRMLSPEEEEEEEAIG